MAAEVLRTVETDNFAKISLLLKIENRYDKDFLNNLTMITNMIKFNRFISRKGQGKVWNSLFTGIHRQNTYNAHYILHIIHIIGTCWSSDSKLHEIQLWPQLSWSPLSRSLNGPLQWKLHLSWALQSPLHFSDCSTLNSLLPSILFRLPCPMWKPTRK